MGRVRDDNSTVTVNPLSDVDDGPATEDFEQADAELAPPDWEINPANHLWASPDKAAYLRTLLDNTLADGVIVGVILANTMIMLIFHPGNKVSDSTKTLLETVDLCFTIFYTVEAVLRIMGDGFVTDVPKGGNADGSEKDLQERLGYHSYWASSWNRLDFTIVTVAWMTYIIEVFSEGRNFINITMLRALRVLRIMHAFRFLSGIRAILNSLGRAAEGMGNIGLMFGFFYAIYMIVGMSLFGGALLTACVTEEEAEACNATLHPPTKPTNMLIWGGDMCDVLDECPGSFADCEDGGNVCMIVGDNTRGGLAGFDNAPAALLSLFIATTGDNWQDMTWVLQWSPGSSSGLAYPFMVSIQVLMSMVAINIFVAVICGAFDEVRAEMGDGESAFAEAAGDEDAQKEDEDDEDSEWQVARPKGWEAPSYQSDAIEKITEATWFDVVSTSLIIANVGTLCMIHHGMSVDLAAFVEMSDAIFTLLFDIEMIVKVLGLGWTRYWSVSFNKADALVNVSCTLGLLGSMLGEDSAAIGLIKVFRLTRVLRIMRLLGKIEIVRELLDVVLGSWVAVINLCVFIVYCLGVFALFGMHMMGDMDEFSDLNAFLDEGTGDPAAVPRPTFENFIMAFSTCFLMMTGDRWKVTMFTYMQTNGLHAVFFFSFLWILCSCILMNLFVAVVVENFSLAEDEKLKKQKLKFDKQTQDPEVRNLFRRLFDKLGCKNMLEAIEEEHGPEGKSWFIFTKDNPLRKCCTAIVDNAIFDYVLAVLIAANCCMIAYEGPPGSLDKETKDLFDVIDIVLLLIFWIEFDLRTVSMGFMLTKESYLADKWCKLDFLIITTGLMAVIYSDSPDMREVANLCRLFRLLRPLRLLNKVEGMRHIIEALAQSAGGLFGVVLLGFVFYVMFAILGVNLFSGKFFKCDDLEVIGQQDCVGTMTYEAECPTPHAYPMDGRKCIYMGEPKWRIAQGYSFDNVGAALQTLFLVGTTAGWSEALYLSMDITDVGLQPIRNNTQLAALYWICFLFICSFALINLFVGVLIYLFGVSSGTSLQTEAQQRWTLMMAASINHDDDPDHDQKGQRIPQHPVRAKLFNVIKKPWFENGITYTIVFNVIVMMSNYYPEPEGWSFILEVLNYICLCIFTVELIMKLVALGPIEYIRNHWNKIDCFVVLVSWFFIIIGGSKSVQTIGRCLRVFRVVLLVKRFKGLQQIFQLFFISIPAAINVLCLLFMLFFMYACLGMYMFGHTKNLAGFDIVPDGRGVRTYCPSNQQGSPYGDLTCKFGNYDERGNFRNFSNAVKFLLQISSGEDFMLIVPELSLSEPFCTPHSEDDDGNVVYGDCGHPMAFAYVATFYMLAAWLLMNMIIGVIMENYEKIRAFDSLELKADDLQNLMDEWTFHTQDAEGGIQVEQGGKLPTARLQGYFRSMAKAHCPVVPKDFALTWYADVLHTLEGNYHMSYEEQQEGYTFNQILRTLIQIEAGGHHALTMKEQAEAEQASERDRSAKIVVGVIRSWRRQQDNPELQNIARVAMTLRMRVLSSRKLEGIEIDAPRDRVDSSSAGTGGQNAQEDQEGQEDSE